jgi:hypothetical protein
VEVPLIPDLPVHDVSHETIAAEDDAHRKR